MKKLLNLLKQYWKRTFNDETLLRIYYEEKTDCFCWMYQPRPGMKLEQGQMLETPVVFSKRFGFVEWLCSNDKIDMFKLRWANWCPTNWWCRETEWYSDEECLLMLLSIQDEPIKFLCDIMK